MATAMSTPGSRGDSEAPTFRELVPGGVERTRCEPNTKTNPNVASCECIFVNFTVLWRKKRLMDGAE